VKVILAFDRLEAETIAYEASLPPRSRDVMLVATDRKTDLPRLRGLLLRRADVIEAPSAHRGRFYDDYRRQLEIAFYE